MPSAGVGGVGRLSLRESVLHHNGQALDAPHLLIILSLLEAFFRGAKDDPTTLAQFSIQKLNCSFTSVVDHGS